MKWAQEYRTTEPARWLFFNDPETKRIAVQESKGVVSPKLRRALKAAETAFWEEYNKPATEEQPKCR